MHEVPHGQGYFSALGTNWANGMPTDAQLSTLHVGGRAIKNVRWSFSKQVQKSTLWTIGNRTPLSYLAQYDGAATARLLLEEGTAQIDVDIADVDGYAPVLTAVEVNSHQILAVLPRPC